ncbi:aminoglycoside phosphotransferase family protein [Nonomuraea sp. B12E4]|uniref:aminoglycoside phosphotransferase family protein n=1 Tax=Nonomuraea sp. B12E4 TaxID=3153564 RepID=UPI00325DAA3E
MRGHADRGAGGVDRVACEVRRGGRPAPVRRAGRDGGAGHPDRPAAPPGGLSGAGGDAPAGRHRPGHARRRARRRGETARERDRHRLRQCAAAVAEVLPDLGPGDRLLHWDLHYDNVLAADREPWLSIDPKPLAGDPGFDLMPALHNRWAEVVASGDVTRAVLRRFDFMADGLGLDRRRAAGWTLARALQNSLWDVEDGDRELQEVQLAIAEAVWLRW